MPLHIIGAGMAGLLAANILRRQEPVVFEAQQTLPDNHGALLRFRSDVVSRATGIPFRKVLVHKAIRPYGGKVNHQATLRDHNMYSFKVTGKIMERSILNLNAEERYIAPDNFIAELGKNINIQFGMPLNDMPPPADNLTNVTMISTIPMPALMELAKWELRPAFHYREVWSVTAIVTERDIDVYQTIYFPDPCGERFYRASFTGNKLTIEYCYDATIIPERELTEDIMDVLGCFGLGDLVNPFELDRTVKYHKYGKLMPIDDGLRRAFIVSMSDHYNLYSLGRFATWRQLLLDDLVKDVNVINGFITDRSTYARRLHAGR